MALRHLTAGAATAGLVGALTALVLSTFPRSPTKASRRGGQGRDRGGGPELPHHADPRRQRRPRRGLRRRAGRLLPLRERQPRELPAHVGHRRRPRLRRLGLDRPPDRPPLRDRRPGQRHRLRRRHQRAPTCSPRQPADLGHQQRDLARHQGLRRPRVHRRRGPRARHAGLRPHRAAGRRPYGGAGDLRGDRPLHRLRSGAQPGDQREERHRLRRRCARGPARAPAACTWWT